MFVSTQACKSNAELETVLVKEKKATRPVQTRVDGDFSNPFARAVYARTKPITQSQATSCLPREG